MESNTENRVDTGEKIPLNTSMNIIDFLKKNEIAWMPINLNLNGKKKELLPYTETNLRPSYTDFSDPKKINERKDYKYDNIWIDTRKIYQVDVDGDFDPKISTPYFLSLTKNKPHYFIIGSEQESLRKQTKWNNVELLCGQGSYASRKNKVYNYSKTIKSFENSELFTDERAEVNDVPANNEIQYLPNEVEIMLNNIFEIKGRWRRDKLSSTTSCVCFPVSDFKCLVNGCEKHSSVKSRLIITRTRCTAKCFACTPNRNIQTKDHKTQWKLIKSKLELTANTEEEVKYSELLDYVEDYCEERDLMKKDGYMMRRSSECRIEYEQIAQYDRFLDMIFKEADLPIKRAYRGISVKKNLINYLEDNHVIIPVLERDQNLMAFKNGYFKLDSLQFVPYEDKQYKIIAKKYIPFDFDINWLNSDWEDINCPNFDKIINDQKLISEDPDVKLVFYGFLGGLHYPVQADCIHAVPYLIGTSGTGKSTVVNIVSSTFSPECIGVLNFKEKVFGKTAFLNSNIIIDPDTPADMIQNFGKTDFQKAVSGEIIPIPVKHQKQETQHKVSQRMLLCSQYMQDIQDTGEVIRRIAYFKFEPIENANGNMEKNAIENELHLVFIKMILARKSMLEKYGNIPFHDWNNPYFDSIREDILVENNPIFKMINQSDTLIYKKDALYSFSEFLDEFNSFYATQPRKPKKPKTTDVIFTKLDHRIVKKLTCKGCGKPFDYNNACCENYSKANKTSTYYLKNLTSKNARCVILDEEKQERSEYE